MTRGDVVRAEYRVLGPLEVLLDGEPVAVPAGRSQVLPAALLSRANRFVPTDELVHLAWDGTPQRLDRAKATLQMVVRRNDRGSHWRSPAEGRDR